jgi:hypothetical protein
MRISQLRYMPIEGGTLGGHFALHVVLGSSNTSEGISLSEIELLSKLHKATETLGIRADRAKAVLFDVRKATDLSTEDMISILGTLRDWKYTVIAWVGDEKRYAWFDLVNYLTVFINNPHWPNFKVSEIRYTPQDEWLEPDAYEVNASTASYVVMPAPQYARKLLPFVCGASHPWGIITSAATMPFVDFLEGK